MHFTHFYICNIVTEKKEIERKKKERKKKKEPTTTDAFTL